VNESGFNNPKRKCHGCYQLVCDECRFRIETEALTQSRRAWNCAISAALSAAIKNKCSEHILRAIDKLRKDVDGPEGGSDEVS